MNFQMFKLDLEKAEEPEIKLPTSAGSSKKQESSRKTSISALLTIYIERERDYIFIYTETIYLLYAKAFVWITINCGKF